MKNKCKNCNCIFENKKIRPFCSLKCSHKYQKRYPCGFAKLKGKFSRGNKMRLTKPIECFWDDNGCLISISKSKDKEGYSMIMRDGKRWHLNRWIFYLNNGYLPPIVMHTCDNPACINPQHLVAGTTKENALDMVRKGRAPKGLNQFNGGRKLTESQVKEIKKLIPKLGLQKIANKYHVSQKMIFYIKHGKKWKHIK